MRKDETTSRGTSARTFARWTIVCLLAVALTPPAVADEPDAGSDRAPERSDVMALTFDELEVRRDGGRLLIDYSIDLRNWERLRERRRSLWIRVHIPTDRTPGISDYTYTARVAERSGPIEFPKWLSTFGVKSVGLCPLATGVGDNIGLGRGWICRDVVWQRLQKRTKSGSGQRVEVELQYHWGMPYSPFELWNQPEIPGFVTPFSD